MITLGKYDLKYICEYIKFVKEFQDIHGDDFCQIEEKYLKMAEIELKQDFPSYIKNKILFENESFVILEDGEMIGEII
jgi:hypothetical protein